jgi:hypothetical protein
MVTTNPTAIKKGRKGTISAYVQRTEQNFLASKYNSISEFE